MVRLHASATALLLAAAGTVANAKPVLQTRASQDNITQENIHARYDVGFDDSIVRTLKTTDVVPEIVYLDSDEYRTMTDENVTNVEPFIPEQERSAINGNLRRWIMGKDDREQFTSRTYPWRNVGRM